MNQKLAVALFTVCLFCEAAPTKAQMYINEIYFNAPGISLDLSAQYVEIRGTANESLEDHYLIFLDNSDNPGAINAVFDFGSLSNPQLGSNGFLTLRQNDNPYGTNTVINPNANNFVNSASLFAFGSGNNSSVGFRSLDGSGRLNDDGFTAMLIRTNGDPNAVPFVSNDPNNLIDLDTDDDNELDPSGKILNWVILDSIGVNPDSGLEDGFLYAPVNFGVSTPVGGANVPAGAEFVDLDFDNIEYLGRWGNSIGDAASDWHASNLTNDVISGYVGPDDFRQSADPQGSSNSESSQGVVTGTIITGTLGGPNLPEPSSMLIVVSGMLLIVQHRRR